MAEKETKNNPKAVVEATPEEVEGLNKDKVVSEELKSLEPKKKEEVKPSDSWVPKTDLGRAVLAGKIKDIDEILDKGKKILEYQIVDSLLKIDTDLILIGQAKGKFGGGKRRAWRQTQKKTKEGNVLTFSSMAIVGDRNGHIGIGYGRSKETLPAREKATRAAKLNLIKVERGFESPEPPGSKPHTVPFKVDGKCGSVKIVLIPAPRGTGLAVADECKKILKLAGIEDVYGKTKGKTKTTFNLAKACVNALEKTTRFEK